MAAAATHPVKITQQTIVFAIFVLMFVGFAVFLGGFFTASNLLGLLQNVAILGSSASRWP